MCVMMGLVEVRRLESSKLVSVGLKAHQALRRLIEEYMSHFDTCIGAVHMYGIIQHTGYIPGTIPF